MARGGSCWRPLLVPVPALVLALVLVPGPPGVCSAADPDSGLGALQLRRLRGLAARPRHGDCWARALLHLDTRCRRLTAEEQSRLALRFTLCHLSSSGRDYPSCLEGDDIISCTAAMDAAAFHSYTEFFTHTLAICQFLQADAWRSRAEGAMHRLTESSAGVAEQLESSRRVAEDLMESQSAALQAQQEILSNGEELRASLRDSTEGLRSVFAELSSSSREQQVALAELFTRISYLHSFLLLEAHGLTSCCGHAAALAASYLLTATRRSSRARLLLLGLVCVNFYLEKKIYQFVTTSGTPEHQHLEVFSAYVTVLRRGMAALAVLVLLLVCVRYRDPVQQSLQVLQQLRETQRSLQEALQHAESLGEQQQVKKRRRRKDEGGQEVERRRRGRREEEEEEEEEEECSTLSSPADVSHLSLSGWRDSSVLSSTINCSESDSTLRSVSHNATVRRRSPGRGPRRSGPSRSPSRSSPRPRSRSRPRALVYSVLVEDQQRRYSLRNRRSDVV